MSTVKTLKFTHRDLWIVVDAMVQHYNAGGVERDEMPAYEMLLARLRSNLGDMNYAARQAGEPVLQVRD